MTFGGRLQLFLGEMGLKSADIHRQTGISTSSLSRYLSGERNPSQYAVAKLASVYNVNANWLLTGNGEMFNKKPENQKIEEELDSVKDDLIGLFKENKALIRENAELKIRLAKLEGELSEKTGSQGRRPTS